MDFEEKLRALNIKIVGAIALGGALFYLFFIFKWPDQLGAVTKLEKELRQLDIDIKKADKDIGNSEKLQSDLSSLKQEVRSVSKYFVFEEESKKIEKIISEDARISNISLSSIQAKGDRFESARKRKGILQSSIDIDNYILRESVSASFSGKYFQLMRFLSYLTRSERVISIKEIKIYSRGTKSKESKVMNLGFNIGFETYLIRKEDLEELVPAKK